VAADHPERTGALVVRAWVEPGRESDDLRARITYRADVAAAEDETVRVVSSREQILDTVTDWLDELTAWLG
jgi:hypothetical protein